MTRLKLELRRGVVRTGIYSTPDFIGIGVEKAGTTSLYRYLVEHPDILPARSKEIEFFNLHYDRGIDWYRAQFPFPRPGRAFHTGEFSTYYLFYPDALPRIARHVPKARFIVLLRDPVKRIFSHYNHNLTYNPAIALPLEQALSREFDLIERQGPDWYLKIDDPQYHRFNAYLMRGAYARQLKRWFAVFPREQFCILKSEAFFAHPAEHVRSVLQFIGVDPLLYPPHTQFPVHNEGSYRTAFPVALEDRLRAFYRPYNQELTDLIGFDLDGWETTA